MAKATTIKIKLNSTAGTGYYYVAKKNSRTMTEKMVVKKYDPVISCLLYTSPSPRDRTRSRMPSSA